MSRNAAVHSRVGRLSHDRDDGPEAELEDAMSKRGCDLSTIVGPLVIASVLAELEEPEPIAEMVQKSKIRLRSQLQN